MLGWWRSPRPSQSHAINETREHDDNPNTDAPEASSEPDVNADNDGKIVHLASDIAEPDEDAWNDPQSSPPQQQIAPTAYMGASNSHEVNAAIHDTVRELRGRTSETAKRAGTLKAPQNRASNPSYRNPVTMQKQRRLGAPAEARKDTWDVEGSPERIARPLSRSSREQQPFSPLKHNKRNGQITQATVEEAISLRKSQRVQEQQEKPSTTLTDAERYQDHFADQPAFRARRKAATPVAQDNEDSIVREATAQEDVAKTTDRRGTGVRKPGRPKKLKNRRAAPDYHPVTASEQEPDDAHLSHESVTLEQNAALGATAVQSLAVRISPRKHASQSPQASRTQPDAPTGTPRHRTAHSVVVNVNEDVDAEEQAAGDNTSGGNDTGGNATEGNLEHGAHTTPEPQQENLRAHIIRPSDLLVHTDNAPSSADSPEKQVTSQKPTKKRKRSNQSSSRANTSAKIRRQNTTRESNHEDTLDAIQDSDAEADEAVARKREQDAAKLCGQWQQLKLAVRNLRYIGCRQSGERVDEVNDIELKDEQVKAIIELCDEAKEGFSKLRNGSSDDDPVSLLIEIHERVDGLRGRNEDYPRDLKDTTKMTNIYYFLFDKLVRLVWHAAKCYLSMDSENAADGQLTMGRIRVLKDMVEMIIQLVNAAKKYDRPDENYCIIQPVERSVAGPLRRVLLGFRSAIENRDYSEREKKRKARDAERRAQDLEREEQHTREQKRLRKRQEKWNSLHFERREAECGILTAKKLQHLQIPSNLQYELDQNGRPFSREEVFAPRIGPPPGLVDEAARIEWTGEEMIALAEGLQNYTGRHVYERMFRKYCQRGRVLNRFNVTEIVTTAANLKEMMIGAQKNDETLGGEVEQWVQAIPVWTKGHTALGKENEDSFIDLTTEA